MWRCLQSTIHKLDGYGCKNALRGRFFAILPKPARSGRKSSPKDRQINITPTLWEPTTSDTMYPSGRRPLANNEAGTAIVLRNVSPVLQKERTSTPRKHLPRGPTDLCCPGNPDTTIERLAKLLSSSRSSACNDVTSVDDLIFLYKRASEQSLLQYLSAEQMTQVLSICGTSSMPLPRLSCIYDSYLVPFFKTPADNTNYWPFVLRAAKDKKRLSHDLTLQDRYWIMRACLARIENDSIRTDRLGKYLAQARLQYDILKLDTDDPDVHLPYFRALFSLKNTAYLQHAASNLCHYIEQHSNPSRPFPDLLWRLVAVHGHRLSLELKNRICSLLFNRIGTQVVTRTRRESIPPGSNHILGVSRLNTALLATMFRCYSSQFPPGFLQRWAVKEARQTLSPTLDMGIRWNNLLMLSTHMFFGVIGLNPQSSIIPSDSSNVYWRTTLMLGTINEALSGAGHDLGPVSEYVRGISYPLWQMWRENTAELSPQPVDIIRAYVSAFLRIAAKSKDVRLKDDCFLYCQQHVLWVYRQNNTPAMKSQAIDTIIAYILADISCAKSTWADLYEVIAQVLPNTTWQNDVTDALLDYYAFQNIGLAYDLYLYSKKNVITVSSSSLHALGLSLASFEQWSLLAPILENETFSREQTEQLLGAYLRVFQTRRHEYADQSFVALLGQIANKLYAEVPPPLSLMYPLRYFFSIMIATHNSSDAVKLIMAIYRTKPDFFTMRLVLRLVLQLVRRRQLSSAVGLYNLFRQGPPSPSVGDIRRKLALKLSQSGSRKLARRVDRTRHGGSTLPSRRESLARAVGFRTVPLSRNLYRVILPSVTVAPTHGPTIRHAVSLLVRARRLSLARKLFRDSLLHLDLKTKTAIGNIILHGPMYGLDLRNRRLVRHVLRTKDLLVSEFGFIPDRTTVNIIIKAMLRWRSMFDTHQVKQMFDQMVHQGYPVPDQWRRRHGVPFDTPQSATSGLSGMALPPHISFTRHIRPMYKLFIKALYLRNDRVAAKVIIGILKMVEIQYMRELEKRNRARREGIIKKRLKMSLK